MHTDLELNLQARSYPLPDLMTPSDFESAVQQDNRNTNSPRL